MKNCCLDLHARLIHINHISGAYARRAVGVIPILEHISFVEIDSPICSFARIAADGQYSATVGSMLNRNALASDIGALGWTTQYKAS